LAADLIRAAVRRIRVEVRRTQARVNLEGAPDIPAAGEAAEVDQQAEEGST
jgi:hypothetical protein